MFWHATEREAKKDAADRNVQLICGVPAMGAKDRLDWGRALQLIEPTGMDILEFVRFGMAHWHQTKSSVPFSALAEQFRTEIERRLAAGERMGKSNAQSLSVGVHRLEGQFGERIVSDITTNEVRNWISNLPGLSPRSKQNVVKIGRQVFGMALDYGYSTVNPFKSVKVFKENVTEENGKIHIFTTDETSRLLNAADPRVIPFLALWFFCGIRRATLERLKWTDFQFEESRVVVPGFAGNCSVVIQSHCPRICWRGCDLS